MSGTIDEKSETTVQSEKINEQLKEEKETENITCKELEGNTVDVKIEENVMNEKAQQNVDNKASEENANVYAYLERDNYTTEKFKIEIRGLPKHYGIGEFKKFLNEKLQLNASKIKPPRRGSGWAYVCFRSEEGRDKAITALNGAEWKHSKLTAHVANPAPDPYIKRKLERIAESNKKARIDSDIATVAPEDRIRINTTPLWNMPYEKQLEFKQNEMKNVITRLGQEILKVNKNVANWFNKQKAKYDGLPIELGKIVHANVVDGYRNKCEFTVGLDVTGKQRLIGFRISSYAAGSTAVGPIDHLCHIPQRMKTAIKVLEKFIRDSKLDVFDPVTHNGYWRQITARTTQLDHLMLIIGIHPQNLSQEDRKKLQNELKEFFEEKSNAEARVTSLYFQTIEKKEAGGEGGGVIEHISGTTYIEETLLGMTFRISPEAFFQVNSLGAEILYKTAIDLAQPSSDTAMLDVCCGTGTIGLAFAKHCAEVLGIEVVPNAIKDAKENAKVNNITNCEFFVGKAEDILMPVINRISKDNIIAVVDPPRAGLHQKALVAMRKVKRLSKLVYISCDPKAAIRNLVDLARPNSKQYFGEPLVPVKAVPVDMFPYTKHCELVLYLERFSLLKESDNET